MIGSRRRGMEGLYANSMVVKARGSLETKTYALELMSSERSTNYYTMQRFKSKEADCSTKAERGSQYNESKKHCCSNLRRNEIKKLFLRRRTRQGNKGTGLERLLNIPLLSS
jgi:hypothetical protein